MKFTLISLTRLLAKSALILGLLVSNSAQAYFETFDNRADFDTASINQVDIDFEGYASNGSYYRIGGNALTEGLASFSGSNSYLYVVDDDLNPVYWDWGSDAVLFGTQGGTVTTTFSSGVHAVGSELMALVRDSSGLRKSASEFTVTLSNGTQYSVNSMDYPNRKFFGVISDEFEITSISFTAANDAFVNIDNFVYGDINPSAASAVPNPGVLFMLIPGLVYLHRRSKT